MKLGLLLLLVTADPFVAMQHTIELERESLLSQRTRIERIAAEQVDTINQRLEALRVREEQLEILRRSMPSPGPTP